jgi:hypothetical protein
MWPACELERSTYRPEQRFLAEGLGQEIDGARAHRLIPNFLIFVGGNKNNGNAVIPGRQTPLHFQTGHSRHLNIEDETLGFVQITRAQEGLSRRENLRPKSVGFQ